MNTTTHEVKLLVFENTEIIETAKAEALERAEALNSISDIFTFESEDEFIERTKDLEKLKHSAMLKDAEISNLAKRIDIRSISVPKPIQEALEKLKGILAKYYPNRLEATLFEKITFDGKWIPDTIKLNQILEHNRFYATNETSVERYKAAKGLVDFMNKHNSGDNYSRHQYVHAYINWDGKKYFVNPLIFRRGSELTR
ncbi:MAG: hypothetical protein AB7O48_10155 [Cyclobacteriaceae bacterium]